MLCVSPFLMIRTLRGRESNENGSKNYYHIEKEESMGVHAAKPVSRPKPDVKRFSSKKIDLPPTRDALEMKLVGWIGDVLDYIGQNEPMEGLHPASYLIVNADGIDDLMVASRGMALGPRDVYAYFDWGRKPNGRWFIRHVKFGISLSRAEISAEQKRALKERLLDQAETENASHFHARQIVFPAEDYVHTWTTEIAPGETHVNTLVGEIYEAAQKEAAIPDNWVKPEDMALSFGGDAVQLAKGGSIALKGVDKGEKAAREISLVHGGAAAAKNASEMAIKLARAEKDLLDIESIERIVEAENTLIKAERTLKLAELHERADALKKIIEGYKKLKDYKELDAEEAEERKLFAKSKGDLYAELGVQLLSTIPGAGTFVTVFAGMFTEIGLANYAGVVARIRGRMYSLFVAGFVTGLTLMGEDPPLKRERDKKYYDLGVQRGLKMPPRASFQTQIYLMDYARQNITSGFWAGTPYAFHGTPTPNWDYPHDWEAKWSPILLGCALVTKLGFKKFMIE